MMNMEIVVRPFRPDDAVAVSSLVAHTMRVSNAQDYPGDRLEALIAYFTPEKLLVLASERHCLVATHQSNVIATAEEARIARYDRNRLQLS